MALISENLAEKEKNGDWQEEASDYSVSSGGMRSTAFLPEPSEIAQNMTMSLVLSTLRIKALGAGRQ